MPDIARQRLYHQRISHNPFKTPAEVVKWMGAMQAQDYHQSLWAVAARTQSATLADIERAIAGGDILRTWPMRGTIHFVPPEDAGWMLQLSAAKRLAADKRRQEQLELDDKILGRCRDIFGKVLEGHKQLSRPTIMGLLEEAGISTKGQRGYHILWYWAQSGLICLGPMEGKQQTFTLLDEWVKNPRQLTREESLVELAGRYFASHGPATVHDFAWWTGLTVTDAKTGLEGAKPVLVDEKINGKTYGMGNETLPKEEPSAYLLAGFDEYLLGYKDRGDVLAAEHANRIVPGNNGIFFPMIVIDGQVVGTWKREVKKKQVLIDLQPFAKLTSAQQTAVEAAAQRYGDFHSLPVTLI